MRFASALFVCVLLAGCSGMDQPPGSTSSVNSEGGVLKRKGPPPRPSSSDTGTSVSVVKKAEGAPKKKKANPVLEQIKDMDLAQAQLAKYFHGKWGVMLKNQIRVLEKDLRQGISEDIAFAKVAEHQYWISFRQWQGDYPYTVAGLQARQAQWQKVEIELPRQLGSCLRKLEYWQAINDEKLEDIEEFISFFSK